MAHEKVDFMTPEPEVFLYKETNNQIIRHFNKEVSKSILMNLNMQVTLSKRRFKDIRDIRDYAKWNTF